MTKVILNTKQPPVKRTPTVADMSLGQVFYFLKPEFGNGDLPQELYVRARMTTRESLDIEYTAPSGWVYAFRLRDGIMRIRPEQWEVHPLAADESVTLSPNGDAA